MFWGERFPTKNVPVDTTQPQQPSQRLPLGFLLVLSKNRFPVGRKSCSCTSHTILFHPTSLFYVDDLPHVVTTLSSARCTSDFLCFWGKLSIHEGRLRTFGGNSPTRSRGVSTRTPIRDGDRNGIGGRGNCTGGSVATVHLS